MEKEIFEFIEKMADKHKVPPKHIEIYTEYGNLFVVDHDEGRNYHQRYRTLECFKIEK